MQTENREVCYHLKRKFRQRRKIKPGHYIKNPEVIMKRFIFSILAVSIFFARRWLAG